MRESCEELLASVRDQIDAHADQARVERDRNEHIDDQIAASRKALAEKLEQAGVHDRDSLPSASDEEGTPRPELYELEREVVDVVWDAEITRPLLAHFDQAFEWPR